MVWGLAPDAAEEADFLQGIGVQVTYVARGERPDGLEKSIPSFPGGWPPWRRGRPGDSRPD